MTPIEPGSSVKRCQLKPNEICGLIDLAHGNDPTHLLLQKYLHELVFNLERPPSCQPGSQCRFKKGESRNYPKCVTGGPWDTTITDLDFGDECAIGLLASPGGCKQKSNDDITLLDGYFCYNHGPPRNVGRLGPGDESKLGFCSTEFGPLGVTMKTNGPVGVRRKEFDPLVAPFIHPRSVPIKGQALRKIFQENFQDRLWICLIAYGNNHAQAQRADDACSTSKTAMAEQAWKFFVSLEGSPPAGQEFVATAAEVRAKVQEIETACLKPVAKFCQVYQYHSDTGLDRPALKCVAQGAPDADGNDGKCQEGGNVDMSKFDKDFETYLDDGERAAEDVAFKRRFRQSILDNNPEPPCDPLKGALPPQMRTNVVDTLEGNFCPEGSVCYEDYSNPDYYVDNGLCTLDPSLWKQRFACHDVNAGLINCEKEVLDKKVQQTIENLDKHAKLKEGAKCDYHFERVIRANDKTQLEMISPYVVLNRIAIRGEICDKMGRSLECSEDGVCQCMGDGCTEPESTTRKPTTGPGEGIKPANKFNVAVNMLALDWQMVMVVGCGIILHFEYLSG